MSFEGKIYYTVPYRIITHTYDSIGRIKSTYDSTWLYDGKPRKSVYTTWYRYTNGQLIISDNTGWSFSYPLDKSGYANIESTAKNEYDSAGNLIKVTEYNDNWTATTTYIYDPLKANLPPVATFTRSSKNLPLSFDAILTDSPYAKQRVIGKFQYSYDNLGRVSQQLLWTTTLENTTIFEHTDGVSLIDYQYDCH